MVGVEHASKVILRNSSSRKEDKEDRHCRHICIYMRQIRREKVKLTQSQDCETCLRKEKRGSGDETDRMRRHGRVLAEFCSLCFYRRAAPSEKRT